MVNLFHFVYWALSEGLSPMVAKAKGKGRMAYV